MGINKIVLNTDNGEQVLVDLTGDSVSADSLVVGHTAHGANGELVEGTNPYEMEATNNEVQTQADLIEQIQTALRGKATGGGGGELDIPSGYKRVDYILFTGEQVVDTGIICNENTKIQTYFTRESSAQKYLYGVASSGNTASVTAYLGGSWRFGNKNATKPINTVNANIGYFAFVDNTTIGVTGSVSTISDVNDFETVGTMLIGSCRSANGEVGLPQFVGKIFFFAMWEGDKQVLKLVPVTDGNGVYRFFDMVSKTFFDSVTDTQLDGGNL